MHAYTHVSVEMAAFDHFLALTFVREATPTHLPPGPLTMLEAATDTREGRARLMAGRAHDMGELLWAMGKCVELVELGCSNVAASCCEADGPAWHLDLEEARTRFEAAVEGLDDDVDHDGDDERFDDDLVDCGPEYPRNDAGEWLGRM